MSRRAAAGWCLPASRIPPFGEIAMPPSWRLTRRRWPSLFATGAAGGVRDLR
jgi:hypothetical protein